MNRHRVLVVTGTTLALLALATVARAHPLAPSALRLTEQTGQRVELTWRTPLRPPRGQRLSPQIPGGCTPHGDATTESQGDALVVTMTLTCEPAWLERPIGVRGLSSGAATANVIVEVERRDGRRATALLHRSRTRMVPTDHFEADTRARVGFLSLGARHLLSGLDHVLFILGLVLLVRRPRALLALVTAFTLGHSLSLAATAWELVRVPSAPVEVAIALSLLWLGLEVVAERNRLPAASGSRDAAHEYVGDDGDQTVGGRSSWNRHVRRATAVCAAFGLLHGLGFAGAFAEAGATEDTLPMALLGFNVGLELAQLAIVVPAAGILAWLRRRDARLSRPRLESRALLAGAYALGPAAIYLTLERLVG